MASLASMHTVNMQTKLRLAAIDLDGTTLRRDKSIGAETIKTVNDAIAQGIEVVVCTGRSRVQCQRYIEMFPSMRYVITSSGAAVYDTEGDWRKIISNEMSSEIVLELLEATEGVDCFPIMSAGGKTLYTSCMAPFAAEYGLGAYTWELNNFGTGVESLPEWYRANPIPVESLSLYFRDVSLRAEVVERMSHLPLYFALPGEPAVEISLNTANKGDALIALCRMLNIPMEQTMAIGDSDNDIPMLRTAGVSVASGNAPDAVKEWAHCVTSDCDHDGVAAALKPYLLNHYT